MYVNDWMRSTYSPISDYARADSREAMVNTPMGGMNQRTGMVKRVDGAGAVSWESPYAPRKQPAFVPSAGGRTDLENRDRLQKQRLDYRNARANEQMMRHNAAITQSKMMMAANKQKPIVRDTYGWVANPSDTGVRRQGPETTGWGDGGGAYRFGANDFGKVYTIDQWGNKRYR